MKTPSPGHPITITPAAKRWRGRFNGHVIADSADALILREASYPPVVYFPRDDVSMEFMARTERTTHCPFKGDATYYTLTMDGEIAQNVVWSYETPFPAMTAIAGRLAFYPDQVELYEVDDDSVDPRREATDVDQAVLHTDSGSGQAQQEHWAPNVTTPEPEGGVR